jgi:hypothetical protein
MQTPTSLTSGCEFSFRFPKDKSHQQLIIKTSHKKGIQNEFQ